MTGTEYVRGWIREREHQGGNRGPDLPPRVTAIPVSPIHAVPRGETTAACGVEVRHTAEQAFGGGMGECSDCLAAISRE